MKSLAQRIALQFSFVLALLVVALAGFFVFIIGSNARDAKDKEINQALETIIKALKGKISLYLAEGELPYYITYTIYDAETKEITATNAPFIPILPPAEKKPVTYIEK